MRVNDRFCWIRQLAIRTFWSKVRWRHRQFHHSRNSEIVSLAVLTNVSILNLLDQFSSISGRRITAITIEVSVVFRVPASDWILICQLRSSGRPDGPIGRAFWCAFLVDIAHGFWIQDFRKGGGSVEGEIKPFCAWGILYSASPRWGLLFPTRPWLCAQEGGLFRLLLKAGLE